jgi:hypothetical protein
VRNARWATGTSAETIIRRGLIRLGLPHLVERFASIGRADYRGAWHRELSEGRGGQRLLNTSTWILDGLWAAACHQIRAEKIERLIVAAVETQSIAEHISGLIDDLAVEWRTAHTCVIENKTLTAVKAVAEQRDAREIGARAG